MKKKPTVALLLSEKVYSLYILYNRHVKEKEDHFMFTKESIRPL